MHGTVLGLLTVVASGVPAVFAAYFGYRSQRTAKHIDAQLVTGNNKTVGDMVTEVHGKESLQDTDFQTHVEGPKAHG